MRKLKIIVADTETSGLTEQDGPCEIAWLEINEDFQVISEVRSLIDPEVPIKASASGIHGITDSDVVDAPTLKEFFHEVMNDPFTGFDLVFVAHNAPFDWKFFEPYVPNHHGTIDTLRLARHVYPDAENHKLQTLRYMHKLDGGDAHSAMGDVRVCLGLLKRVAEVEGLGIRELISLSYTPIDVQYMPFGKHKGAALSSLPGHYVKWLLNLDNIDDDLRLSLEKL